MKRVFTVLSIAAVAALGLSACSSDSEPAEEPVVEETTAAPEEVVEDDSTDTDADADTGTEETLAEACLGLTEPLQEASIAIQSIAEDGTNDPENAVEMWRALSEVFEDFGESASDSELAALSAEVGKNGHALTDAMEAAFVEKDAAAMTEVISAQEAFFDSYEELLETCTPNLP